MRESLKKSGADNAKTDNIVAEIKTITRYCYRVFALVEAIFEGDNFLPFQQLYKFIFKELVGFYDPPKENINKVLEAFYAAGISVKIITGDNAATTEAIAKQIAFKGFEKSISCDALMQ